MVDNEVLENAKFNTLKTKVNEMELPDSTTLIHINQHNTDKQNLDEKIGDFHKKIPGTSSLVTTTVLNTKIGEVEKKIPNTSNLVTANVLNTKINSVENKILNHDNYINTPEFNELTAGSFSARLKEADLMAKTNFDNKRTSFNR